MASPAAPLAPRPRPGRTRAVAVVLALAGLAVPALLLLPRDRTPAGSVTGSAAPAAPARGLRTAS